MAIDDYFFSFEHVMEIEPMNELDIDRRVNHILDSHPDIKFKAEDIRAIAIKELLNEEIEGWRKASMDAKDSSIYAAHANDRMAMVLHFMVKYLKVNV
jgi:hypothetical protein